MGKFRRSLRLMIDRAGRVIDKRFRLVYLYHYVDKWMFHCLKETYGPVELRTCAGVLGRGLQLPFCCSNHIGSKHGPNSGECLL